MRKIDAEAFNKKILDKIEELDLMVKKINPENVKYFDAELIEAAKGYVETIKDCSWSSNSNFNGIEMHKVKDIIKYVKQKNRKLYINRDLVTLRKSGENVFTLKHRIEVPETFDGRSSIIYPTITYENASNAVYSKSVDTALTLEHRVKFLVYKRTNDIDIDFEITVSDDFSDVIYLSFLYLIWR